MKIPSVPWKPAPKKIMERGKINGIGAQEERGKCVCAFSLLSYLLPVIIFCSRAILLILLWLWREKQQELFMRENKIKKSGGRWKRERAKRYWRNVSAEKSIIVIIIFSGKWHSSRGSLSVCKMSLIPGLYAQEECAAGNLNVHSSDSC